MISYRFFAGSLSTCQADAPKVFLTVGTVKHSLATLITFIYFYFGERVTLIIIYSWSSTRAATTSVTSLILSSRVIKQVTLLAIVCARSVGDHRVTINGASGYTLTKGAPPAVRGVQVRNGAT